VAKMVDHEYYLIREAHERRAAAEATNPGAKAIHLQLAKLYAAKASDVRRVADDADFLLSRFGRAEASADPARPSA